MSGQSLRIACTSSRLSSRLRMMRVTPCFCQNFTAALLVVLACTERWIGTSGQRPFSICSRTSMIRPASAMMIASGLSSTTGCRSRM